MMTNEERIEDVKEQLVVNAKINIEDINWLIQQTGIETSGL